MVQFTAVLTNEGNSVLWVIQDISDVYQQGIEHAQAHYQDALRAMAADRNQLLTRLNQSEILRQQEAAQLTGPPNPTFMHYDNDEVVLSSCYSSFKVQDAGGSSGSGSSQQLAQGTAAVATASEGEGSNQNRKPTAGQKH